MINPPGIYTTTAHDQVQIDYFLKATLITDPDVLTTPALASLGSAPFYQETPIRRKTVLPGIWKNERSQQNSSTGSSEWMLLRRQ